MASLKKPHTIRETLRVAVSFLNTANIPNASNDAWTLLGYVIGYTREKMLLHLEESISKNAAETYEQLLKRRSAGEPLQYLVGYQEFMSLPFLVSPAVLIPRPETELLVEKVIEYTKKLTVPPKIVDVCTGSGCIIISICYYVKKGFFLAGDISSEALKIARKNAARNSVSDLIQFYQADFLADSAFGDADVIVSNPPYIPNKEIENLQREVRCHEPQLALAGGEDGLDPYRRIIPQAYIKLKSVSKLFLEIGYDQGEAVKQLCLIQGFKKVTILQDYAGLDRIVTAEKGC